MPLYEYCCDKCGTKVEILWNNSFSRPTDLSCYKECDGRAQRINSSFSIGNSAGNRGREHLEYMPSADETEIYLLIGPINKIGKSLPELDE